MFVNLKLELVVLRRTKFLDRQLDRTLVLEIVDIVSCFSLLLLLLIAGHVAARLDLDKNLLVATHRCGLGRDCQPGGASEAARDRHGHVITTVPVIRKRLVIFIFVATAGFRNNFLLLLANGRGNDLQRTVRGAAARPVAVGINEVIASASAATELMSMVLVSRVGAEGVLAPHGARGQQIRITQVAESTHTEVANADSPAAVGGSAVREARLALIISFNLAAAATVGDGLFLLSTHESHHTLLQVGGNLVVGLEIGLVSSCTLLNILVGRAAFLFKLAALVQVIQVAAGNEVAQAVQDAVQKDAADDEDDPAPGAPGVPVVPDAAIFRGRASLDILEAKNRWV